MPRRYTKDAKNTPEYLYNIKDVIIKAKLNCEAWGMYKRKDEGIRERYINTMNEYSLYFQIVINAHFSNLIILLYSIYDKRPDVYTLRYFFESEDFLSLLKRRDTVINQYSDALIIWEKVKLLRHKIYAHNDLNESNENFFKKTELTPNMLKSLVELSEILFNEVNYTLFRTTHCFNLTIRNDLSNLLSDLSKRNR